MESGSKTHPRIFLPSPQANNTGNRCHHASNDSRTPLRYKRIPSELCDTYDYTSCSASTQFLAKMRTSCIASALTLWDRTDRQTHRSKALSMVWQLKAHVATAFSCNLFPRTRNHAIPDWFGWDFIGKEAARYTSCFISANSQQKVDFKAGDNLE